MSPWIAGLVALFVWWFSTGAILMAVRWADKRGAAARLGLTVVTLPLFGTGIYGVLTSLDQLNAGAAYHGFLAALALWAWIELAFLTGAITGPNTRALPEGVPEWERFIRAWGTVAYHEILLTATLLTLVFVSFGAVNSIALWTFSVLYFARISAKLNLYLGVPKINVEFIPSALAHLQSHFRTAPLNWLFPFSITALTFATACWVERLYSASEVLSSGGVVGFALLTAITALATLEHWFMVLPLPDEKLWRWMLPDQPASTAPAPKKTTRLIGSEDAHGL
ncbi:putative photosynthetic complex assembly protein PuhE [Primorskyibacter sp. S187A]|uniref:putative photosynthetic complex assembly protein PuhE n=1 Tax=Primorskyibacter sp. S187A TaxID=3415130 RepID=UPI003C7B54A8